MARKQYNDSADLTEQLVALAQFAAERVIVADRLAIKQKVVVGLSLSGVERMIVAGLPDLSDTLRQKWKRKNSRITIADTAATMMVVAQSLLDGDPMKRLTLLFIAKKLIDCLDQNVVPQVPPVPPVPPVPIVVTKSKSVGTVFHFKITLLGSKAVIWRRIQVKDCTLDKLHEHIQAAMGWTNSHLHHFEIKGERYGDPELIGDDFAEFDGVDSTKTKLSELIPEKTKRLAFRYEYDFGDGWEHKVQFEGRRPTDPKVKYPVCIEGERACPPEDCGGVWGYSDLLEAISNPKHQEHRRMLEWVGGSYDPEEFDPAVATKAMKKGLPDWRQME